MTAPQPIEALYEARDAVDAAASAQANLTAPTLAELHSFGSAIVTTLAGLDHLSQVLTAQVTNLDTDEIERTTIADKPVDDVRMAAMHMAELSEILRIAVSNANRYWSAIEAADEHTENPRSQQPEE